tara:strand:- start:214 stop:639 length:426 start_codon:yes stop_codon:yes gene_type:complete
MIIHLKKYKEHGYLKAIWLMFLKVFINTKYKLLQESNASTNSACHYKYPGRKLDFEGNWNCTTCYLCSDICPSKCIQISGEKNQGQLTEGKAPKALIIGLKSCTQCMLCIDVCPTAALVLHPSYSDSDFNSGVNLVETVSK